MDWFRGCAAIIPCFNEAATVAPVVRDVRAHLATVWVVDDGSEDDTGRVATAAGAEVLRHPQNRGKGAALQTGWEMARQRGFPWVLTLDGDGQHSPADIPRFFDEADRSGAALVIGNRFAGRGRMPWVRREVNRWMSRRLSELTGRDLPDSQCGFRLIRLSAMAQLPPMGERFEIESAVLVAYLRAGLAVEFVPIDAIYPDGHHSHVRPVRDSWRWLHWWWLQSRR